ncbi:hypothetical protein RHGRI_019433 [Rhododendron griersonianum]|uniref:BHLH domain-containing protein n=1 Tax=Rhododendron griersonianum TaxID=479676 RepID=A0AAV6JCJ9_9ERIC|nr:hypothetical protein RHGRI_019433 [Rhododendron griersonianum]
MYQDSVCFDPNTMQKGLTENGFSQTLPNITTTTTTSFSMEELSYQEESVAAAAMEMELQQQLGLDTENCYANNHHSNLMDTSHLMQEVVGHDSNQVLIPNYDHNSSWDINNTNMNTHDFQEEHLMNHVNEMQNSHHLLNLLRLPKVSPSSVLPNSSFSLGFLGDHFPSTDGGGGSASNVAYDPLFHLNLPPQPPYFRDLFQSLPHGYNLPGSRSGSLFGGVEEREGSGGGEVGRNFDNGVLEFQTDWDMNGMAKVGNGKKNTKHFATERDRREHLNIYYPCLKCSPILFFLFGGYTTKPDRATIVGDAIDYIKELLRTVNELKILVEKKQCGRERIKRHKTDDGTSTTTAGEVLEDSCNKIKPDPDHSYSNGSSTLRSSWLQRKSQDTEVDVRIVDDEVTIKLAQRKRINCLLIVSKVLDELQLDIQHVAGGLAGDYYSFLFNSKIGEGSSVYASAIANKLIDVVNRQYAAIPPTHSY